MMWIAGIGVAGPDGAARLAGAAGANVARAVAGPHGVRGSLERALPGEWAALIVTVAVIALVGAVVLVATCLGHERAVARRRARRAVPKQQAAPARTVRARDAVRVARRRARLERPVHT